MISDYVAVVAAHRRMYDTIAGSALHATVAAHAALGLTFLGGSVPQSHRSGLAVAVAESCLLAGRIELFDMRQAGAGQSSFVTAVQAAEEAGDGVMASAVLAHMAFVPAFSGDHRRGEEARDKIRAARAFARRSTPSPVMLAWLNAVEAEVETLFGDTKQALRLISRAEELMSSASGTSVPVWFTWFSRERLAGFKGCTLMMDGQLGPARLTLRAVLETARDGDVKQRAVTLADLAAVEARSQNPEESCRLAVAALENLTLYWYATAMDRVRAVRQLLEPWEGLPCVRALDDRLYDWSIIISSLMR